MHSPLTKLALSFMLIGSILISEAQEEGPLHLVISKVGNRVAVYGTDEESKFTLMAEIQGALNFSLNGDFEKAEIVSAATVAPDGKTYELKAIGEQPPAMAGNLMRFLSITHGDAHTDFSIGKWKVTVKFKVDGKEYIHEAEYLVTWRKPDEGIWQNQHWANESPAEQGGAGQPATRSESKPEGGDKPQPESERRSR